MHEAHAVHMPPSVHGYVLHHIVPHSPMRVCVWVCVRAHALHVWSSSVLVCACVCMCVCARVRVCVRNCHHCTWSTEVLDTWLMPSRYTLVTPSGAAGLGASSTTTLFFRLGGRVTALLACQRRMHALHFRKAGCCGGLPLAS